MGVNKNLHTSKNFKDILPFFIAVFILSFPVLADDPNVYRSYQTTIYCKAATTIQTPSNTIELIQIIQNAIRTKQTVKAVGSRHSITDIICTNGIPISMENINYARINSDNTATFGAGIKLVNALEFLESNNLSLIHVPTFGNAIMVKILESIPRIKVRVLTTGGISIGGAIGTGAHGSTLRHPSSLSDQIVSLNVITGNGFLVEISGPDLDIFRVNLGLLGIIVDVTFATVPLFKMTMENRLQNDGLLFDGSIPQIAATYDMFQLWWFPQTGHVVVGTGSYTSKNEPGHAFSNMIPNENVAEIAAGSKALEILQATRNTPTLQQFATFTELSLYVDVIGKPPIFTENANTVVNPATGYAWRLQSNTCNNGTFSRCSWFNGDSSIYVEESSMAFDISNFTAVMTMMQKIIKKYPAAFALIGIYIRFAKSSSSVMAISSGRTTFTVEWTTPMRQNPFASSRDSIGTYQAILQEMVMNYGARPHWGKNGLYYFTEPILNKAVPNRQLFINAMKTFDPNGIFLNAFGRRMLGISDAQDRDPRVTHCALQDYCICSSDSDCGPLQRCNKINGFPVCEDNINLIRPITSAISYVFSSIYNLPAMLKMVISPLQTVLPLF